MIVTTGFASISVELFRRGLLRDSDSFVFCPTCEDVVEAWEHDLNTCSACGFTIPDVLTHDMYRTLN